MLSRMQRLVAHALCAAFVAGMAQTAGAQEATTPVVGVEPAAELQPEPAEARAGFLLRVDELVIPYSVFAIYLDGGQQVVFDTLLGSPDSDYQLLAADGDLESMEKHRWRWTAPDSPGLYVLAVSEPAVRQEIRIHAFVRRPLSEQSGDHLKGYHIGTYPTEPLRGNPRYNKPSGLVEVTRDNRDTLVSPHFRLGQFLTKQGGDWPRYVALNERLLLKLEMLLQAVREQDIAATTLHVMSGYRTPQYNRAIGNVPYSRHVYGDAADVFVDVDGDGRMDDLNGDGESDFKDAAVMAQWADALSSDPFYAPLVGGLGRYGPKPHRGPFIHVDTRGHAARWDAP